MAFPFKIILIVILSVVSIFIIYFIFSLSDSLPLPERMPGNFRIGVANLEYKNTKTRDVSVSLIKSNCDLLILLEWTGSNADTGLFCCDGLHTVLNYPRAGTHGICVLVRDHLKAKVSLLKSPVQGPCMIPIAVVRISIKNKNCAIFGVHAPPPVPACKETTIPTLKIILSWVNEGILIKDVGAASKGNSVIVAGDLNVLPFNNITKEFNFAGLMDSFKETNRRFGPTWSPFHWIPAFFRLDYIFISSKLKIENSWAINLPGSDHRAVISDFHL